MAKDKQEKIIEPAGISVGNIQIQARSLKTCRRMLKSLLRDKEVISYLQFQEIKKITLGNPYD